MKRFSLILFILLAAVAYGDVLMDSFTVGDFSFQYPDSLEISETTMGVFIEAAPSFFGQISQGAVEWSAAEDLLKKKDIVKIESFSINNISIKAGTHKSDFDGSVNRVYVLTKNNKDTLYVTFKWKESTKDAMELAENIVRSVK